MSYHTQQLGQFDADHHHHYQNNNESNYNLRHHQDYEQPKPQQQRYQTKHLPMKYCQYMNNDTLCQQEDEYYGMKKLQNQINQKRRLSTVEGTNIRVLVLLVQFSDHLSDRILPTKDQINELYNGPGSTATNPIGSIRAYFYINSLTKYNVTFDVQDWQQTDNTEAFFAAGVSGQQGPTLLQNVFTPVLNKMDAAGFDFAPYDSLGVGELDQLVILTSGYSAEYGEPPAGCSINSVANRIWSTGVPFNSQGWVGRQGIKANAWAITSAYDNTLCGNIMAKMGTALHEITHGWDTPDLYDQDVTGDTYINPGGVGVFDIMSSYFGWKVNPSKPGHMSAWIREKIGWVTPIEIKQDGYYPIQCAEASGQVYKIYLSSTVNEYLLIENRQPILWDSDIDGGGVVIYHYDGAKIDQSTRGYPGHANWPADHYMLSVLQADGLYEIEKGLNSGNKGDFWTFGLSLKPGGNDPNTDSITNGRVQTGITIEVVTVSQLIMMIRVSGLNAPGSTTRSEFRTFTDDKIVGTTDDPKSNQYVIDFLVSALISAAAMVGFTMLFL